MQTIRLVILAVFQDHCFIVSEAKSVWPTECAVMPTMAGPTLHSDLNTNDIFTQHIMSTFGELYHNHELCDYELESCDEEVYSVHKVYLAAVSPYFRAMFTADMLEKSTNRVQLKNVSSTGLGPILDCIYHCHDESSYHSALNRTLTASNALDVLNAASLLQLPLLVSICSEFLCSQLSEENCVCSLRIASMYSLTDLEWKATKFLYDRCNRFICGRFSSFGELDTDELTRLITKATRKQFYKYVDPGLTSDLLFKVVLCWIDADLSQRTHLAVTLLRKLHLNSLSMETLKQASQNYRFLKGLAQSKNAFSQALKIANKPVYQRAHLLNADLLNEMDSTSTLILLGRPCKESAYEYMAWLDDSGLYSSSWCHMTLKCPPMQGPISLVAVNNYMLVSDEATGHCWMFDPVFSQWQQIASLPTNYTDFTMVACDHNVFVIAGCNNGEYTDCIRRYIMHDNRWEEFATHSERVKHAGACVHDGSVYIVGGTYQTSPHDKPNLSNNVFVLKPETGIISYLTQIPRCPLVTNLHHATIYDNCLVVVYRKNDIILDDPMKFDLDRQTWLDQQTTYSSAIEWQLPFSYEQATSGEDKVFCFPKSIDSSYSELCVRVYDRSKEASDDSADIVAEIPRKLRDIRGCVLTLPKHKYKQLTYQ